MKKVGGSLKYFDARTAFWFRRPGTDYGWKLDFYPDWKIFDDQKTGLERLEVYLEQTFDKIAQFVSNHRKKFSKENLIWNFQHLEKTNKDLWELCPCGYTGLAHELMYDYFLDICTNYSHN